MKTFIKTFLRDESGASAAEYALILAVVGVAIGAAAFALGEQVSTAITGAAVDVQSCNSDGGCTDPDVDAALGGGGGSTTSTTSTTTGG